MYGRLIPWLATTVVAVFPIASSAAAAVAEDVPVPGGTASIARAFGVEPVPDRGRFVYEMARLLYNVPEGRKPIADAYLQMMRQPAGRDAQRRARGGDARERAAGDAGAVSRDDVVPVPLTADLWSSAIFHRKVASRDLVLAILADHAAALLALGLTVVDDATLAYLADHPLLLERIYERSTPAFVVVAGSLHISNNRVVPPGGEAAIPLWEGLVAEKTTRADRFLMQLLELSEGRYAYLYGVIGDLDPPHRAFALGAWMPNAAARGDRFKTLAGAAGAFRESHLKTLPYGRSSFDLTMALMRVRVDADGTPRAPAGRVFWSRIFGGGDAGDALTKSGRAGDDDLVDAAWLSDAIGSVDVRQRAERLDQIALAQRVFGEVDPAQRVDLFTAVRALPHYRMLVWTLERMGVAAPEVYAAAVRKATRIGELDGRRAFEAQAQFQGALAIVARMRAARTIDVARAQALVSELVEVPLGDDGRYAGAVARWVRDAIVGPRRTDETMEAAVLAAMSGAASGDSATPRTVVWEGQAYRLDLGAAERQRLAAVRERQEAVPLDVPLELAADARVLAAEKASIDDLQSMVTRLTSAVGDIPRRVGHEADVSPPGVPVPPNLHEPLRKLVDELARDVRAKDVKRAARAAAPLVDAADALLAQALMSIAYAAAVGDPEGEVLLADDVSLRHDFGLGGKDADARRRPAWALPHAEVSPGSPWHVSGSIVGLDLGLANLALRRLNYERVLEAPRLTSNERDTFALSVSMLNPYDLRDADRDLIATAVERGQRRIATIIGDPAAVDEVADELSMEGWRRRALRWMAAHETDRVASMFTLTEALALGGGLATDVSRWGMAMLGAEGCPCSRVMAPGRWSTLLGRPPLGLTATAIADLHLHAAMMLRELRLPAALAKVLLSAAVQDFIDEVKPTDDSDWLTMVRFARSATRERVEDYIAAATAAGPLLPANGTREAAAK